MKKKSFYIFSCSRLQTCGLSLLIFVFSAFLVFFPAQITDIQEDVDATISEKIVLCSQTQHYTLKDGFTVSDDVEIFDYNKVDSIISHTPIQKIKIQKKTTKKPYKESTYKQNPGRKKIQSKVRERNENKEIEFFPTPQKEKIICCNTHESFLNVFSQNYFFPERTYLLVFFHYSKRKSLFIDIQSNFGKDLSLGVLGRAPPKFL